MTQNEKTQSTEEGKPSSGRILKAPPFGFYFVFSFTIAIFWLVQDGFYRYNSLLRLMKPLSFLQNTIVVFSFFLIVMLLFALLVYALESITIFVINRKKGILKNKNGAVVYFSGVSTFLYYLIFAYTFATYFKFFTALFISGFTSGETIKNAVFASFVLLVLFFVLFFLRWRAKHQYENIKRFIDKAAIPVGIIYCLTVISSVYLYAQDRNFDLKRHGRQKNKPNIILLSMDSARNKNMNLYGYSRENTPNINTIAQTSYVFDKMMSSSNSTPICIPTIILGKNPVIKPDTNMNTEDLLTVLKQNGYNERIFVSEIASFFPDRFSEYLNLSGSTKLFKTLHSRQINNKLEWLIKFLAQDERYYQLWNDTDPRNITFKHANPGMDAYLSYIADKLSESDSPVFVWIHFMETHYPFGIPSSMRDVYKGSSVKDIDQFDISILYVDSVIGNLRKKLMVNGEWDHSLLILTADHGSSFPGDLPYTAPYNALVMANGAYNIPFLIHMPGQKERVDVKTLASQIDMAPTILDLLKLGIPASMEGESLTPYLNNPEKLSNKVKISVQGQYFLKKMEEGKSQRWADSDYINVFYEKYMVRLSLNNPVTNRMSDEEFRNTFVKPVTNSTNDKDEDDDDPNAPIENTGESIKDMPAGQDLMKYKCYGVFNIFDDREMNQDLINTPAGRNVLEIMKNSPVVKSYQDI